MAVQKFQVIFENQITKVFVKKTASDTKELLEGAKWPFIRKNTCIEAGSQKEEHCVEGLEVGKTYTLRELSPAPGYATAAEQVFQMEDHKEEDGTYQGQKLEMQDPPTEVHITVFEKDGDKKVPLDVSSPGDTAGREAPERKQSDGTGRHLGVRNRTGRNL